MKRSSRSIDGAHDVLRRDASGYLYNDGGISNQKLALLGLFVSALHDTIKEINLPYLFVLDHVGSTSKPVAMESVYPVDNLLTFASAHQIEIEQGEPRGEIGGWGYFARGIGHIAHVTRSGRLTPDDFACVFFRHFRPSICDQRVYHRLSNEIFGTRGIQAVVQLRIEVDWVHKAEDYAPSFREIISKTIATLPEARDGIYIACDEASLPISTEQIRDVVKKYYGVQLWWKSDFLSTTELSRFTVLDLSVVDFEMAVTAPRFVGLSRSTFSNLATFEAYSRRKIDIDSHYIYNLPGDRIVMRRDNGAFANAEAATRV